MSAANQPLIVLESFIGKVDGVERIFRAGELIRSGDPAVKKWPDKFGPFGPPDHREEANRVLSRAAGEVRRPAGRGT